MKKESGIIIENNKNPSIFILNGSERCNDGVDKLNKSELTDVMKRIRLLEESILSAQKELGVNNTLSILDKTINKGNSKNLSAAQILDKAHKNKKSIKRKSNRNKKILKRFGKKTKRVCKDVPIESKNESKRKVINVNNVGGRSSGNFWFK